MDGVGRPDRWTKSVRGGLLRVMISNPTGIVKLDMKQALQFHLGKANW